MADISDVESALVALISGAVYPNGTSSPSAIVANGTSLNCRVISGWPIPGQIDADMTAIPPVLTVSVYPQTGMEKNTTRFPRDWYTPVVTVPTLTATVSGLTVTIGGTVTAGHFVTIHAGGLAFSYAALSSDTLTTVAAALQALVAGSMSGSSVAGSVITFPATMGGRLIARTGAPSASFCEVGRSNQRFCITIWASNNAARVAAAKAIKPVLDFTDFVALPDNYSGELKYESSTDVDRMNKSSVSCRDLYYWVEYPTTLTQATYPLTTFVSEIEADAAPTTIQPLPLPSFTPGRIVIN
jgi:hypothetical protein